LPDASLAHNDAWVEESSTQDGSFVPPATAVVDDTSGLKIAMDGSKVQQASEMTVQQLSEGQAEQQDGIAAGLNKLPHASDQLAKSPQVDAIQLHQDDSAAPMKLSDAGPIDAVAIENAGLLKGASSNFSLGNPVPSDFGISAPPSGNPISTLLSEASAGNSNVGLLLSHALIVPAFSPEQNPVLTSILVNSHQQSSDTVVMTSVPAAPEAGSVILPTTSSGAAQYPIYDQAAQATLQSFLQANPQSEVIYYQNNLIVYDGVQVSPSPIVVKVWEFQPGGQTITIVGHADHGLVAI
jgi:hypothetical protein